VLGASDVGAWHQRKRLWLLAYTQGGKGVRKSWIRIQTNAGRRMYYTPKANDANKGGIVANDPRNGLPGQVNNYPTVTVQDSENDGGFSQYNRNTLPLNVVVRMAEAVAESLNPDWVEWLMGWPYGWTHPDNMVKMEWPDWTHDPHPEPPRTTNIKKHRRKRLKALGNGQVPLCAAYALTKLMEYI
jgi:hypothetical protein